MFYLLSFVSELCIPLTSTMCGASPGAWFVDITVSAPTWATPLTVAAQIHGPPKNPPRVLRKHNRTISQCKPPPFFFDFSNMISLTKKRDYLHLIWNKAYFLSIYMAFYLIFRNTTYSQISVSMKRTKNKRKAGRMDMKGTQAWSFSPVRFDTNGFINHPRSPIVV